MIEIFSNNYISEKSHRKEVIDSIFSVFKENGKKFDLSLEELYLIIDEAVTNAVEHGNKWDPGKKVFIKILEDVDGLCLRIKDEGDGFDSSFHKSKERKRDILSERGRGIYIIQRFCDPRWNNKGNQIEFKIHFKI
jgi:anti-sigma regulatory factor (Ser/Thr protein kinase)